MSSKTTWGIYVEKTIKDKLVKRAKETGVSISDVLAELLDEEL